ncbi:CusB/HlyD membrane fusion family barrel-sandwich protein [Arcticibacter tournemirensis]|uniref:HlyD family efflux transporter periplasmic adaptor subunit n=1 Tax=Arcticibacter tournemirensis TaxID=699437 RepID=A0A5M9H666_9SPHI|nr:biotin/lipoyl-binding protein [Arcticibacter tournemirensis]KAA8482423.1 HlyD family efflux transporter periplasmic adaptor subunit [Arcticibacter tournemirensis]TQM51691.1 CusB/HlyD membrane fusion family barrel-sandwich protein [Arcticibacter tournemirensis]
MKTKMTTPFLGIMMMLALISCSSEDKKNDTVGKPASASKKAEMNMVVGIARIEPEKGLLNIYANANGRISKIVAAENQSVSKGSDLALLDNQTDNALLAIEQSKAPAQNAAILSATQNAKAVLSDLQKAQKDEALNEQLFKARAITEQALNDSKSKVTRLQYDYQKLIADIAQQKSKVQEIDANIKYRKAILSDRQIKSAYPGRVLQWDVHDGDYVTPGQKLGQYAPDGPLIAVTEVDELFSDKVAKGMRAEIYSQMNGQKTGSGTVVFIAEFLKKKSLFSDENTVEDRRVREVKVLLNSGAKVNINNKVDCKIYLK